MKPRPIQVLLVEDNPGDAFIIQDMFEQVDRLQVQLTHVERLADAFQRLAQVSFDVILLDLSLPDSQGLETLSTLHPQIPNLPIVVLTGTTDEELAVQAVQQGAQDYLIKGQVQPQWLIRSIRYAIERQSIESDLKQRTLELSASNQELARRTTQLEAANQALAQQTAQLEVANRELEAFSYSVSHDLMNPLTGISSFAVLMQTQHADQLNDKGKHHLAWIIKSASRMEQIIQDLLQLSRMTRSEMNIQPVDLSAIAQEVLSRLQQNDPDRQLEIVISPGRVAQGDPRLLQVALENLLGNAWKYTSKEASAYIEFGTVASGTVPEPATANPMPAEQLSSEDGQKSVDKQYIPADQLIYFIRDNGIGFDMEQADNIFAPFQRLGNAKEFTGTGIGLATVQRIIHRHGGLIWVEAKIDQGTTFYFTLPHRSDAGG
ncbi:MAG: response regulator [Cyanothece sp. SIO1E1]|nr:response regulator [Cyanothece sp. SIO1E1]